MQRIMTTIVRHVATHPSHGIDGISSTRRFGSFDVIDVVRSGLNDHPPHPYPSDHTVRETLASASMESIGAPGQVGAEPPQRTCLHVREDR